LLLTAISTALPASAATFSVTAKDCKTSPGGYQWAIEQANATPGRDTISIEIAQFRVDDCDHPDAASKLPIAITESVDILGNGNTAAGNVAWVNTSGVLNPNGICPPPSANFANEGGSLLDIGVRGADNSGIDVTISDLKTDRLMTVGFVRRNATLTIEGSEFNKSLSVRGQCNDALITAESGADVTLKRTKILDGSVPTNALPSDLFPLITGLIFGRGGDLIMDDVDFLGSVGTYAAAVEWNGGTVKIVNSRFLESHGLWLIGTSTQFVNSLFQNDFLGRADFSDNIILFDNAVLNSEASTFYWSSLGCSNCPVTAGSGPSAAKGLGIVGYRGSTRLPTVTFNSTALGSIDAPEPLQHLWGDPQVFNSDAFTWVQPTAGQDATQLAAILPNASTATPGLTTQIGASTPEQRMPIIPGVLIEGVPDAGTGGVNELFNPIDGLPLTMDVEGRPRVYANDTRNIGAVQNYDAPNLGATPGDTEVILGWSPTPEGQVAGYEICTSTTPLPDPMTGACPGTISAAGANDSSQTITGLTNGTPYYFAIQVIGGIWSNVATATPMGPLGLAQPTAVIVGDGSLQVFWAEPTSLGGYSGLLSYSVLFRPVGTQTWLTGPQGITARTTLLPDLTNGTTYEIGVLAQTDDGGLSPALGTDPTDGIGRGTPQAAPTLSYANPGSWPQNTPLTLVPTVTQLQGSGTYSIESGSLPDGMSLDISTGVIFGAPTTQQSTSATIRLTDGITSLLVEALVPLIIVAPSPSPQLWYPAIQTTVGVGPASATPTQANIPAGATFSVVAGESLPAGFSINATSGVILGTATTVPGQVLSVDIQACWGGCDPNAGEVSIAPALFYILPRLQYPANTNATAGIATTITPTVDLWGSGMFSIQSGSLPAGMNLDPVTGVIGGTPETASTSPLTIRYSTGINVTTPPLEYVYSTTQINVAHPTITLVYPEMTAYIGESLSVSPTVSGLTGTAVYSIVSNSLPQGLSLDSATGVISGVLTDLPGSYPLVIEVVGPYGSQRTSVVINLLMNSVIAIPTLSEVGAAVLVGVLLLLSMVRLRKRRRAPWESAGR
jgi:hypothetical protein